MSSEYIEVREGKKGTTYKVSILYTVAGGERKKYSKSFPSWKYGSKKLALKEATIHRDFMKAKLFAYGAVINNDTFSEVFEMTKTELSLAYGTMLKYDSFAKKYIYPIIRPTTPFKDVRHYDIAGILQSARENLSQHSLNRLLTIFRNMYKIAIKHDIVAIDESMKVTVPRSLKPAKEDNQDVTMERVFEVIEGLKQMDTPFTDKLVLLIYIMLYEGVRPAEAFALEKEDFDFESGSLSINKYLRELAENVHSPSSMKTSTSNRVIPLAPELQPMIEPLDDGPLFLLDGKYITSSKVSVFLHKHYEGFHLYQLRHRFATDLVTNNDLAVVQSLMGHSSPSTTLSYARKNFNDMSQALAKRKIQPQ